MADQTLSQEELKALLDDENAPKRGPHQVVDYDFAHPTRLTRDQNRALLRVCQTGATAIAADLCAAVRAQLQVASSGISEIGFAGLRSSLPNPSVLYVL